MTCPSGKWRLAAAAFFLSVTTSWGLLQQHIEGVAGVAGSDNLMLVLVTSDGMTEMDDVRTYDARVLDVWHAEPLWQLPPPDDALAEPAGPELPAAGGSLPLPGQVSTASRPLTPGKQYLLAGMGGAARDGKPCLLFHFAMEVPQDFDWRKLAREPVTQRVRAAMEARRKQLEAQLKQLQAEQAQLKGWLKDSPAEPRAQDPK